MALQPAQDAATLLDVITGSDRPVVVAFLADFSVASMQAKPAITSFCARHPELPAYSVDVTKIRDVHRRFGVEVVPTVLVVQGGSVLQSLEGAQTEDYYESAIAPRRGGKGRGAAKAKKDSGHKVTVYSTDTCPWCTRVKAYLRDNKVSFSEINVQRDESAARRMVAKSGQHGVPQVEIDGTMIVGFDRGRIDSLLELRRQPTA
jgi:glutaredoxin-like YruB-family protein